MYRVEYYCPRQSPYWQRQNGSSADLERAIAWAQFVKPPNGSARVIDSWGNVVYQV